jgi:hypothetical protein
MQRFIHGERPSGPNIKIPPSQNGNAHHKNAQRLHQKRPSNLQHNPVATLSAFTIARIAARRGASAKGVQNKPLNPLLELTSSLEEAPDARCLFGRGPDVPFEPKESSCSMASIK